MGRDGDAVALPIGRCMRRRRQIRRGVTQRRIAARRPFADGPLADGDDPPFEERDLDIAAGANEKPAAPPDVEA